MGSRGIATMWKRLGCPKHRHARPPGGVGLLQLAESLSEAGDEASLGSGTSRAYYAAFHAGKELAVRRGLTQGFSAHAGVWQNFNPRAPGVKRELWGLYTKAKRLQEKRETADYHEAPEESIDWARECKSTVEESKKFPRRFRSSLEQSLTPL